MIGRKSLLIVISKAVSAILGFAGLYLMTRYFPESTYGQIAYTLSLIAIFGSFSDLGFATSHIKRISEGKDPSDCLSSYLVVKLVLIGTMVGVILTSVWIWTGLLDHPLNDTSIELIALFTLYFVFYNFAQIATATFDAHMQTAKTQISLISEMVVRVPLILFFAIPIGGVYALAWTYVLGGLTVAVISVFLLSRERLNLKRPTLIKSMANFALPLAISAILGIVIANVDKVTLGYFWGPTDVANYAASQSVLNMLFVFGAALSTLLFPTFSRLYENGERHSMREIIQRGERYLSYIITPIVCVFLIFPVLIATVLLGAKYVDAAGIMQILSLTVLVLSLGGVYSAQIVAMNRARELVWLSFVHLLLLLALIIIFVPTSFFQIPMLGLRALGTAIAVFITALIVIVIYRVMIWRMVGLGFNHAMSFHLMAALISIITLLLIGFIYQPSRWYDIILVWMASAGVFYLSLYLMRELKEKDIHYFMEVINPQEMMKYLKMEFKRKP